MSRDSVVRMRASIQSSHSCTLSQILTLASKNVFAIKAALNDCSTVEEWETITGCIEIPEELFSYVYSCLIDLSWQDIEVEVS